MRVLSLDPHHILLRVTLGPLPALMYNMRTWLVFFAWVPLAFVGVTPLHADEFTSNGVKIHYVVRAQVTR